LFVHSKEGTHEPIASRNTWIIALIIFGALVVYGSNEPNGVFNVVEDIHPAFHSGCGKGGSVGFENPLDVGVFEMPFDRIPLA
jgi:hypothetical protein